ncbi:hypothetical protein ACAX43_29280 [Paraburkholderia sp. IW21]|uniref:hypothetical protein n=1 Tax=Paraburkholderia sp. IW21 TaxID=3242488 RepID=UPI003520CD85
MHALNLNRLFIGSRARQRGIYDLLSLGIGASIAIAFAATQIWAQRQEILSQQTAAQGNVLADIGNSINGVYLAKYYSNLVDGTPIAGVANAYAPTMTELQNLNVIPAEYTTTSAYGTPYVISLAKTPAGCVAPSCDVNGLVYIAGAITDPSTDKPLTLDDGAAAIGGDGGYSDLLTPDTITGISAGWSQANPMGNVAGILAMRVGYGSSGWAAYVRRDGSLPMEGALNFKGTDGTLHDISNAATVNAQKVVAAAGGNVQIGSSTYYGDGANSAIYQTGSLFLQHPGGAPADIALVGNVNSAGTVTAAGAQVNGNANVAGQASINGNTIMGNGTQIYNPGTQYIETGGGNLYLKPWNGAGVTVVGGGGGSGQLLTTGRLTANEYIQPNGYASAGTSCSPNGLIGNSGNGPLFCQNYVWQSPGQTPSGTMCGYDDVQGGTGNENQSWLCGGYDPFRNGCPAGYYLANVGAAQEHWFYSCLKS